MAQIRIVDDWRRSPASGPSHYRSVMVIAEKWAEQRVLMRAYAESRDQLRPTIVLHGVELAIGPAGLELNGPWGIHVGENADARAHHIKEQLEHSARRMSGSKGSPPLLADGAPTFEREPTANWAPSQGGPQPQGDADPRFAADRNRLGSGAPRVVPARPDLQPPQVQHVVAAGAARIPAAPAPSYVPPAPAPSYVPQVPPPSYAQQSQAQYGAMPTGAAVAPSSPELRTTPRPRTRTRPPQVRTALGYTSGSGAQSALVRLGLAPHVSARLGRLVDRVVPSDFHIDPAERRVLNALGEGELTARGIGHMLNLADPVSFMEALTRKLEYYHLDLVDPGDARGGEPSYRLRH